MKDFGKGLIVILVIIVVISLIIVGCENISKQSTQLETQKFENQMHQDPNTWNKEQRDRYNDFTNWETEQQKNK